MGIELVMASRLTKSKFYLEAENRIIFEIGESPTDSSSTNQEVWLEMGGRLMINGFLETDKEPVDFLSI